MSKFIRNSSWMAGSLGIISGILNLIDRGMTLEYQDRQSRRLHDETVLEISERASIIRAKIEADAKHFQSKLSCVEAQLENANTNFAQIQNLLIDAVRETSDTDIKLHLIEHLAILHKSFYEYKSPIVLGIINHTPERQMLGNSERKLVIGND